ncbi:hypothetical protein [Klebsiella phage pKP-M186-2.2]|nr:hypothetical protein [Klebsiella phage pKP-M186-2.2]
MHLFDCWLIILRIASHSNSKSMLSAICPVGGTPAPARMTLSLNLVTHYTTVVPKRHLWRYRL